VGRRVLVIGGGGREHALAWTLARSSQVDEILVAPGNAGTATEPRCRNVAVAATDIEGILSLVADEEIDLVVVGPEDPLVAGVVDRLAEAGVRAFGPSAAAAQLEGSKSHCKDFLVRHGIPTGAAATFTDVDEALAHLRSLPAVPVIKASGLAAGKGVIVAETEEEAAQAIREILLDGRFGSAGDEVLLEERLHGPEVSILAFCDGLDFHVMPAAQDHKRLGEGDMGPNTGGMGAFHPSPIADDALLEQVGKEVIAPTLQAMLDEGRPYRGVLYAGMMLSADGPKVIEFNCRFGDPETQVVLPLLASDIVDVIDACIDGTLGDTEVQWADRAAVTVVMASEGYPVSSSAPTAISGLDDAGVEHHAVPVAAADAAHEGVARVNFAGAQHRDDIARATAEVTR
jgi:phosphoribosylamine--glycine ligase